MAKNANTFALNYKSVKWCEFYINKTSIQVCLNKLFGLLTKMDIGEDMFSDINHSVSYIYSFDSFDWINHQNWQRLNHKGSGDLLQLFCAEYAFRSESWCVPQLWMHNYPYRYPYWAFEEYSYLQKCWNTFSNTGAACQRDIFFQSPQLWGVWGKTSLWPAVGLAFWQSGSWP